MAAFRGSFAIARTLLDIPELGAVRDIYGRTGWGFKPNLLN
jgi:hypothetical protein